MNLRKNFLKSRISLSFIKGVLGSWLCLVFFFLYSNSIYAQIKISQEQALKIGVKIWYNESDGQVSGLTLWNKGEDFASLGIGHFIWYPAGKKGSFRESFPALIKYMQAKGVTVPSWLQGEWIPYAPWRNQQAFLRAQNSFQMRELRQFLLATIPIQAEFMARRLEQSLPLLLEHVPARERPYIRKKFYEVAGSPNGIYALVDYVNFKGEGLGKHEDYKRQGWGLLQVLQHMRQAPKKMPTLKAFAWAANHVLTRRVSNAPLHRRVHEMRWLLGWRNRIRSYV
jgi:hypothetical protein